MKATASHAYQPESDGSTDPPVGRIITVTLSLPESSSINEQTARDLLVLALVDGGLLSQSQGAKTLGIGRYDFLELMGKYRIPIVRLDPEEQAQELEALDRLQSIRANV